MTLSIQDLLDTTDSELFDIQTHAADHRASFR
jgi:hypothetical protein